MAGWRSVIESPDICAGVVGLSGQQRDWLGLIPAIPGRSGKQKGHLFRYIHDAHMSGRPPGAAKALLPFSN